MTTTLEHEAVAVSSAIEPRDVAPLRRRQHSLVDLVILAVTSAAFAIGMTTAPQRMDDEGTYAAQAYALGAFGELAHYTYWYDHPPLGWIQIAAWTWATDAFDRYPTAVSAGREAMLVTYVVSAALLWGLARRLDLSRGGAAAAVLIFGLSPLALVFHRTAYLDNVATPWMLAAFLLAHVRQRQLIAFGASGVCMAIAVLSKETYLSSSRPGLDLWRNAIPPCVATPCPSPARSSAWSASDTSSSLWSRASSSPATITSVSGMPSSFSCSPRRQQHLEAGSQARRVVAIWWALDPVLCTTFIVAAAACLLDRNLRPFAVLAVCLVLFMLRPGYLPIPYSSRCCRLRRCWWLVPWMARCAAGRQRYAAAARGCRDRHRRGRSLWSQQLRSLLLADADGPLRSAQQGSSSGADGSTRQSSTMRVGRPGRRRVPESERRVVLQGGHRPGCFRPGHRWWRDYDFIVVTKAVASRRHRRHPTSIQRCAIRSPWPGSGRATTSSRSGGSIPPARTGTRSSRAGSSCLRGGEALSPRISLCG